MDSDGSGGTADGGIVGIANDGSANRPAASTLTGNVRRSGTTTPIASAAASATRASRGIIGIIGAPQTDPESTPKGVFLRAPSLQPSARRHLIAVGTAVLGLVVAACSSSVPNHNPTGDANPPSILPGQVVTTQGQAAVNLYLLTFVIAVIVFVIVEGLLLLIAFRFRRKPGDDDVADADARQQPPRVPVDADPRHHRHAPVRGRPAHVDE